MTYIYFLLFITFGAMAQPTPKVQVIPNPESPEDFEHEFKGCPENSECDQVMGLQLSRWKDLISKLKNDEMPSSKKAAYLEVFRSKYGIPVEFYTNKKSELGFKPLYFNSSCKDHNPKIEENRTLRGIAFLKSLTSSKGMVWRDQALIEVPTDSLLVPQTTKVYYEDGTQDYYLPLSDQPLFIKNKELYVLKEEDDFFYVLKVSPSGEWKIVDLDFTKLSSWQEKKQNVPCPEDKNKKVPNLFGTQFCKSVFNEDTGKPVTVKMQLGCD